MHEDIPVRIQPMQETGFLWSSYFCLRGFFNENKRFAP